MNAGCVPSMPRLFVKLFAFHIYHTHAHHTYTAHRTDTRSRHSNDIYDVTNAKINLLDCTFAYVSFISINNLFSYISVNRDNPLPCNVVLNCFGPSVLLFFFCHTNRAFVKYTGSVLTAKNVYY